MNFTDVPNDTLDDKDFEEIDDDNYYFNSSLGISGIDSSLLEGFLDLDIPLGDEVLASNRACKILNRISQNEDDSFFFFLLSDFEGKTIGPKK